MLFSPLPGGYLGRWSNLTCAYFSNLLVQPPGKLLRNELGPSEFFRLSSFPWQLGLGWWKKILETSSKALRPPQAHLLFGDDVALQAGYVTQIFSTKCGRKWFSNLFDWILGLDRSIYILYWNRVMFWVDRKKAQRNHHKATWYLFRCCWSISCWFFHDDPWCFL